MLTKTEEARQGTYEAILRNDSQVLDVYTAPNSYLGGPSTTDVLG